MVCKFEIIILFLFFNCRLNFSFFGAARLATFLSKKKFVVAGGKKNYLSGAR